MAAAWRASEGFVWPVKENNHMRLCPVTLVPSHSHGCDFGLWEKEESLWFPLSFHCGLAELGRLTGRLALSAAGSGGISLSGLWPCCSSHD